MNITFEGSPHSMPLSLRLEHYPLIIIRPLCLVVEAYIKEVAEAEGFHKQKTLCPYEEQTQRKAVNEVFRHLETLNPEARYSIWQAMAKAMKRGL